MYILKSIYWFIICPLSFTPVVRKCIADLKNELEDNLVKMLQENLHTLMSKTPAPVENNKSLPSTIRQELKNIMKEVLFEGNLLNTEACNRKENDLSNVSNNTNARCQMVSILLHMYTKLLTYCNIVIFSVS